MKEKKIEQPQFINVMIGTAGHIDHGKTQLIKCLTGCNTDRLKEEKERGMSIDLGFAPCKFGVNKWAGIVDVPGHEKFIRNMVAGVTGIDVVLLVVAADDGIMPQTREHLDIINLLGIKKGLVAVTKTDLVDKARPDEVVSQVKEYLAGTTLQNCRIMPVSSATGEGFDNFYAALSKIVEETKRRDISGIFRMPVERKFTVKGIGTVVTGIPVSGKVSRGANVEMLPEKTKVCIRKLQVFGNDCNDAVAGECVALNVTGADYNKIERGTVLADTDYFEPASLVKAKLYLLKSCPRLLKNSTKIILYTGTSEVSGTVVLLDREKLKPSENALVQIQLDKPIIVGPRDKYIVRLVSPVVTIGGGTVINVQSRRLKRNRPWIIDNLKKEELAINSPENFVEYILETTPFPWLLKKDIIKAVKQPLAKVEEVLGCLVKEGKVISFAQQKKFTYHTKFAALKQEFKDVIKKYHFD